MAEFIYDDFYSLAARRRKGLVETPRIELTRLTVDQHRHSVADLVGHFTPSVSDKTRGDVGLRGEYFQSRGMSKANRLSFTRNDPRIDFDFGSGSPHAAITPDQFTIIWEGSVRPETTGYHDFRVTTENGARLYVNTDSPEVRERLRDDSSVAGEQALIDAWVSSGDSVKFPSGSTCSEAGPYR